MRTTYPDACVGVVDCNKKDAVPEKRCLPETAPSGYAGYRREFIGFSQAAVNITSGYKIINKKL